MKNILHIYKCYKLLKVIALAQSQDEVYIPGILQP